MIDFCESLHRVDIWLSTNSESIFYSILSVCILSLSLIAAICGWTKSYSEISYEHFLDIGEAPETGGFSVMSYFLVFAVIYILIGIQCALSLWFEVAEGGLKTKERRINIIARKLAHGAFVIPSVLLLVFSNDPLKFTVVIAQTFHVQEYIVVGSVVLVATRSEFLDRPILTIPLMIALFIVTAGAICEDLEVLGGSVFDDATDYVLGAIGITVNLTSLIYCYKIARGKPLPGEAYDTIILVFSVTIWLNCYRIMQKSDHLRISHFNYANYILFRLGGGCGFLFLWQMRTTYVTLKRIESEETREMVIKSHVLQTERAMAIKLLHSMVPPRIADDLSKGKDVPPEMFDFATVYFSDIEGFTKFASVKTPIEVFTMLNRLFRVMDYCVTRFPRQLYKIETIGDAYMVVGGLLGLGDDDNDEPNELARQSSVLDATCAFALLVREAVQMVPFDETSFVKIRVGIHTGPILAGLSGTVVPRFSCFGDTINTASRMESTGKTNKIHVSGTIGDLLKRFSLNIHYNLESRDPIEVKGKGRMQTYFLETDVFEFRKKHAVCLLAVEELLRSFKSENYALSDDGTIFLEPTLLDPSIKLNSEYIGIDLEPLDAEEIRVMEKVHGLSYAEMTRADFDVLKIDSNDIEGINKAILVLMEGVVGSQGCCSVTNPCTLARLVQRVGKSYRSVPYHNWHHAFCVVQSTASILMSLDLDSQLSKKDLFVLLLSALVHDWEKTEVTSARAMIISCVLATDMEFHASLQEELRRRAFVQDADTPAFNLENRADVVMMCKCLLHAADISNSTRPFRVSARISMLAIKEFNSQATAEECLGMPVSTFMVALDHASKCRSELFFLERIAKPYFFELQSCFPTANYAPETAIDSNIEQWKKQTAYKELCIVDF